MHGYIIVYSITDRRSYQKAADVLASIRYQHSGCPRPIILVANKSDLERSRMIGKEGEMTNSLVAHNTVLRYIAKPSNDYEIDEIACFNVR